MYGNIRCWFLNSLRKIHLSWPLLVHNIWLYLEMLIRMNFISYLELQKKRLYLQWKMWLNQQDLLQNSSIWRIIHSCHFFIILSDTSLYIMMIKHWMQRLGFSQLMCTGQSLRSISRMVWLNRWWITRLII